MNGQSLISIPDKALVKCPMHYDARLVFDLGRVPVYAGSAHQKTLAPVGATVIDLVGTMAPMVQTPGWYIPGITGRYMRINWPDMDIPDTMTAEHWRLIVDACPEAPIFVACGAGHGRTGTALAIIGHLLGAFPAADTDPIDYLRKVYCPEAVETDAQVKYVKALTGRATKCHGSVAVKATVGGSTLCPQHCSSPLPERSYCNRDSGHAGACDNRPRSEIVKDPQYRTAALAKPVAAPGPVCGKALAWLGGTPCNLKKDHVGLCGLGTGPAYGPITGVLGASTASSDVTVTPLDPSQGTGDAGDAGDAATAMERLIFGTGKPHHKYLSKADRKAAKRARRNKAMLDAEMDHEMQDWCMKALQCFLQAQHTGPCLAMDGTEIPFTTESTEDN